MCTNLLKIVLILLVTDVSAVMDPFSVTAPSLPRKSSASPYKGDESSSQAESSATDPLACQHLEGLENNLQYCW